MHARVVFTQAQTGTGRTDEAIRLYRDAVVPAAKQQRGFKGMLQLVDRATGKGISISLWETEADLKASEASGHYQQQIAKFAPFFSAPPVAEVYEVSVYES